MTPRLLLKGSADKWADLPKRQTWRLACYRCRKPFISQNKAEQRHCEACQQWLAHHEDLLQCEAQRYDETVDGLTKLPKFPWGKMTAVKNKLYWQQEMARDAVTFVRLTREQIEKEYPPERIEQIRKAAAANRDVGSIVPQVNL